MLKLSESQFVCLWDRALSLFFCWCWQMVIKVIERISDFPSWWLTHCWKQPPNVSNWRHNSRTVIRTSYSDECFSYKYANYIPRCYYTNAVYNTICKKQNKTEDSNCYQVLGYNLINCKIHFMQIPLGTLLCTLCSELFGYDIDI